jgi:hypothetical protein
LLARKPSRRFNSQGCAHQAFAFGNGIVGLQYHLETTAQSARTLIEHCREELVAATDVQTESEMLFRPDRFERLKTEMFRLLDYFQARFQSRSSI